VRRAVAAFDRLAHGHRDPGCGDATIDGWACQRQRTGHDPAEDRETLKHALRDFDQAAVFTIHGFAQRMLADHAFESGVAFDSEFIVDEAALVREVVEDYWALWTYDAPAAFVRHLVAAKVHVDHLVALAGRGASVPRLRILPEASEETDGREVLRGRVETPMRAWRAAHERAAALWWAHRAEIPVLLDAARDGMNKSKYRRFFEGSWVLGLDAVMDAAAAPPLQQRFDLWAKLTASALEDGANKDHEPPRHPFFEACQDLAEAEQALEAQLAEEQARLERGLIPYVRAETHKRKRRWNKQSFGDLLLRLDAAIAAGDAAADALARGIRAQYPVALIDEFQDTDPVQYAIFKHVYGAGADAVPPAGTALFLIGDPKQAIYGFRGADIFAYLGAKRRTPPERRWTLAQNWRSDPAMVAAVNALFDRPASPFALAGLDFEAVDPQPGARERLAGASAPERAALRLLVPRREDFGREPSERLRTGEEWPAVRDAVAADIVRLLESGLTLVEAGGPRAVRPGDIAILVRKNKEALELQGALRRLGVPSALQGDASVLDSPDAADVARLLAALAEPGDPAALRAALCTAILGQSAHDLDAMQTDEARWDAEAERVRAWHDTWRNQGFVQAYRRVLAEAGTAERLLAREDGERRLTNLLHLGELLHGAATELNLGPQGLRQWLQRVREDDQARGELIGEAAQLRLESDAEAVRLVTIHKAKGLEYGIVYCPTLWGPATLWGGDKQWPRCHDEAGELLLDLGSPEIDAHRARAQHELLAEDLRLLYVALTRARHQCTVVWGGFTGAEKSALAYLLHAEERPEGRPDGSLSAEGLQATDASDAETYRAARHTAAEAHAKQLFGHGDEALREDLDRLVAAGHAAVEDMPSAERRAVHVDWLPPASFARWRQEDRPLPELAARSLDHAVRRTWRVASFSSLVAGREDDTTDPAEAPGVDRDAIDAATAEGGTVETAVDGAVARPDGHALMADVGEHPAEERDDETVPLADFPAGARAGQLLHDILEHTDFTGRQDYRRLDTQVERQLGAQGLSAERWRQRLVDALGQALATPLGEDAPALRTVSWGDRIHEMAFFAPLRADGSPARSADVADAMAAAPGPGLPAGYPEHLRRRDWPALRGTLHGYVDLIFRTPQEVDAQGRRDPASSRWFLVDYKSNRLGPTFGDYRAERLAEEMSRHDYVLQYHLYVVALHRYLRHRLPGYDYESHFGGVRYLFLRGMRPVSEARRGVFADRPPLALVERLDALLCGGREVVNAASPPAPASGDAP
jgi:exodeoxyribonuclease V beta subunit